MGNILSSIIVSMLSALIGGLFTFLGVKCTINNGNERERIEYIKRIKPYLVLETKDSINEEVYNKRKRIKIHDDTNDNVTRFRGKTSIDNKYQLNELLFSNVSDHVCVFEYFKINNEKYTYYEKFGNRVIKSGEMCEIIGHTSMQYIRKQIDTIAIGIRDRQNNLYEFNLSFYCEEYNPHETNNTILLVKYSYIDCNKEMITN